MTAFRSQRGLAAAAVILIIILGAIALMLGRGVFQPGADLSRREVTTERMTRISKALVDFAKLQGRLPCPARGDLNDNTDDNLGKENRTDLSSDCTKDGVSANDGVVPWKTLGLRRDDALDGWTRKISYRVYSGPAGFTQDSGTNMTYCNSSLYAAISPLGSGSLCQSGTPPPNKPEQFWAARTDLPAVQDLGTTKSDIAFVLVSHGESGYGAYPAEGNARITLPSSVAESANVATSATYYILARSAKDVAASSSSHFDDVVTYMSASDLVSSANMASRSWPLSATFSATAVEAAAPGFDSASSDDTGLTSLSMGGMLITAYANGATRNVGFREQSGVGGLGAIGGSSTSGDLNSSFDEKLTFQFGTGSELGKMDVAFNQLAITDNSPLQKERAEISFWKAGLVVQATTVDAWEFQTNPSRCLLRLVSDGTFDRVDVLSVDQSNSGGSSRFTVAGIKACTDATSSCTADTAGTEVACPISPPSASTAAASSIAKTTATLSGSVEDNGVAKGTGSGYQIRNFSFSSIPVGTTNLTLSTGSGTILAGNCITIQNDANTYVVATALSGNSLVIEDPGLFVSIPSGFPTVRNVTVTHCPTALSFDFGATCSFGSTVTSTPASINAGAGSTSVTAAVTGLTCNTSYCYRTKATGLRATTTGNSVTFTTASCS